MRTSLVLALILTAATACIGNTQRAARVPHPGVPLQSGQPMGTPGAVGLGLSNVTDVVAPEVGNPNDAVEVPGTQLRSDLRLRVGARGQLGVHYEHGFASTSQQPDATQLPVGDGDVRGYGMSGGYSFETSTPGLSIGTTFELTVWSVPYSEFSICTNCGAGNMWTFKNHGRANPTTLGVGVAPSYKQGDLTVFGGVFARNHPTTQRKEYGDDILFPDAGDVENGPVNVLVHAGLEYALSPQVSALVLVHQNVISDPVRYGPGVGLALTASLGGGDQPRR